MSAGLLRVVQPKRQLCQEPTAAGKRLEDDFEGREGSRGWRHQRQCRLMANGARAQDALHGDHAMQSQAAVRRARRQHVFILD